MADRLTLTGAISADDRILPLTRAVAWLVIPFLVAAFIILYLDGTSTAAWFAWEIPSRLTTALMGAGYLGGAYFFLRVGLGPRQRHVHLGAGYLNDSSYVARSPALRWHEVQLGFLPVAVFTFLMLLATLLHWDSFISENWPFWVWLVLYIATPIIVPAVWWLNRPADPRIPAPGDRIAPSWLRFPMAAAGGFLLALSLAGLLWPDLFITIWPWTLSPLTARVMAGWHALLGAGALLLAADRRWSAWRVPMQSIAIWYGLLLVALFWHRPELGPSGLLNWYTVFVVGGLSGLLIVTLIMRRQPPLEEG
jgi:hypothetical protein